MVKPDALTLPMCLSLSRLVSSRIVSCSVMSNSDTPWTEAYQAPLPMEHSRQDYWSRLPFPIQGLNPGLLRCRQISYRLSHPWSPCPDSLPVLSNLVSQHLWKSLLISHYRYSDTDREDLTFLRLTLMDLTFHSIQRGYVPEILSVCWGGSGQRSPWEQGVHHKWMENGKFNSSWLGMEQKCQIHKAT